MQRCLVILFAFALLGAGAVAKERWTVTSLAAPGSVDEKNWRQFIEAVHDQAGDSVELKALIYGEAGTEETYLAHLRRGRVHLSSASFAASSAIVPEVALLSLPYLFESVAELDFVVDGYLTEAFAQLFDSKGLTLLRWLDVGWVNLYSTQPIRSPAEATGKRLRSPASPAGQLFLRLAGADVVVLPFAEVVMSLDTGLIDGGITTGLMYNAVLVSQAPFLTLTRHSYEVGFLLANKKWLTGLSPRHRQLVMSSFPSTETVRADTRRYMTALVEKLEAARHALPLRCSEQRRWIEATGTAASHREFAVRLGPAAERLYRLILDAKSAFPDQTPTELSCR